MRANLRAFERWEIVPRMLRDVSERDLSTSVLGTAMPAPVLLAPVGVQSIVHPEAELAVARAAAARGLAAILSTAASNTLEDVAEATGAGEPLVSARTGRGTGTSPRASWRAPRTPATKRWS